MNAWWQIGGLFLLTFLSEDAAVAGAAALFAEGGLSYSMAFAGAFLGIWLGDLWLYGTARILGESYVKKSRAAAAIARSREWFKRWGSWVLIASRGIPGSRVPTYLAAGVIGYPAIKFALITGMAAAVWVGAILAGGQWLWNAAPWLLVTGVAGTVGIWCLRRMEWEFWPSWLFYLPVGAHYAWLALKYRGLSLPTAANPAIPMGGLVGESKFDTLEKLQGLVPEFTARTWLIPPGENRGRRLAQILATENVEFPFVLKPDVGQRGAGVKVVRSMESAMTYLRNLSASVVLQEYAAGPKEAGVFYYRYPGEETGRIFAITEKLFPQIMGDGVRTLEQLILADPRASKISATYLRRFSEERQRVLPDGGSFPLVQAGNHAQGCIFRDGMHLSSDKLLATLDRISHTLDGFYIGRFDVRYASDDDLRAGHGFTIVELNGAGAEATSIYDSRNSLFDAYRMLFRQWELVFRIGAINRARGGKVHPLRELLGEWRKTTKMLSTYPLAD